MNNDHQTETRQTSLGLKRRRYKTPEGFTYTTIEVPEDVIRAIGKKEFEFLINRSKCSLERKRRNAKIIALRKAGEKLEVIANMTGLGDSHVRTILSRAKIKGVFALREVA